MSVPPESVIPPPPSDPPPPVEPPLAGAPSAEQRQWAMFAHLSSLAGAILTGAFGGGWGCFVGPLIIWLVQKDTMPFVDDQGKEALNFNITMAIAWLILVLLSLVTFGVGLVIAIPVGIIIGIGWLVFTIIAAIKANEGVAYRYPFTLRLIK
jgi:uncharacterized Tic20 family protein